jgi:sulfonate transport system substrate-binding protein
MLGQLKQLSKPGTSSGVNSVCQLKNGKSPQPPRIKVSPYIPPLLRGAKRRKEQHLIPNFSLLLATTLCLGLATSACAPNNSTNSASPTASTQNQSQQANQNSGGAAQNVVRIGYVRWGLLPLIRQRGILERELAAKNIKVEWVGPFPNFAPVLEAMNAGSVDLAAGGDIPAISGLAGEVPVCLIAYRPAVPQAEAILVKADSSIKAPTDLVGKRVAVNRGGWGEHLLLKVLEKANVPKEQVKRAYMSPTDALPALMQGHVDAWAMWDPGLAIAEVDHPTRRIASGDAAPHYGVYVVHRQALADKADAIKVVMDAIEQEGKWATEKPQEAAAVLEKALKVSSKAAKRTSERDPVETVLPLEPRVLSDIQKSADWMLEQKAIPKRVDIASSVCPTTVALKQ